VPRGILRTSRRPAFGAFRVTSAPEDAEYRIPANVRAQLQERDVESLLLDGKLDVLIATNVPRSYRAGDPRIRRVFRDITRYTLQSL
jgi:hypothetical protein